LTPALPLSCIAQALEHAHVEAVKPTLALPLNDIAQALEQVHVEVMRSTPALPLNNVAQALGHAHVEAVKPTLALPLNNITQDLGRTGVETVRRALALPPDPTPTGSRCPRFLSSPPPSFTAVILMLKKLTVALMGQNQTCTSTQTANDIFQRQSPL